MACAGHPGGDLLLRGARRRGRRGRAGDGGRRRPRPPGRRPRGRRRAARAPRAAAWAGAGRLLDRGQERLRVPGVRRAVRGGGGGGGGLHGREERLGLARVERRLRGGRGRGDRRAGATAANCPATAPAAGGRGDVRGRLPVRRDLLLEAEVQVVLVGGVGEVAGAGDRERRADLVRADVRVQRRDLGRDLPRQRAAGPDDLAVDGRDVQAAAVEVVGDRAARGELRVVRAHARDRDLVLLAELGQHADHARVDPPGLDVGLAHVVEHDVLVVQQRERLGVRRAAGADPAPPNCFGSTGSDAAAGAAARAGAAAGPPRRPPERRR